MAKKSVHDLEATHAHRETAPQPSKRCVARCHIKPAHFSLYDFATAVCVAAKSQDFYVSTRHAAAACCASRNSIMGSIQWLVEHGWFEIIYAPQKGKNGNGHYRVVSHQEWVSKYGDDHCYLI